MAGIARDLEQLPEYRAGLGGPPLETEQRDEPLEGLDGAPVAPGRAPKTPFRLREPALPDRDLADDRLGVHPAGIAFAHVPQCREGVLHATPIEEQASEHLPGVAVLGMLPQPTTQAGFHIPQYRAAESAPDRLQARLARRSPEHSPQTREGGQDRVVASSPLQPRLSP